MITVTCDECGKTLSIPDQYRGATGKCNHCGGPVYVPSDALTDAQRAIVASNPPQADMPTPATPKQLSYLRDLGATPSMLRGLSMAHASEMIAELEEVRDATEHHVISRKQQRHDEDRITAKAVQRQTNFHKNACGCLIILLTAPVWIPVLLAWIGSQ